VTPDRQAACGFCDGTGLWMDPDVGPAGTDPCPLCAGAGTLDPPPIDDSLAPASEPAFERAVALLGELTAAERQQLYEMLHARYDCRIYRR